MRLRHTCALLSVSLLASGCSLYRIRGTDQKPLTGIPFYAHVGVCRQETSYVEPVYRVAVQAIAGNREIGLFEATITGTAVASTEFRTLREEIVGNEADPARIGEAFDALTRSAAHRYDPQAPPTGMFMAGNSLSAESLVDYGRPLFMNVSRPWIGSAAASARLAPDGTLAEASAQVKDETVDTLLSIVPSKEMFTAFVRGERARALGDVAPGGTATLQLILEPQFVKHTYTMVGGAPCPRAAPPIAPGSPGTMYRREQLPVAATTRR